MNNVCIVGYGAIGPVHAVALQKTPEANFYAVCDTDITKINKCTEKYDVKAYTDFYEMLEDDNIDSIHICTPHYLHYEMITAAVKKGKRVVAEKPVVMTRQELEKLLLLEKNEKIALVFQNRLNTCIKELKKITDEKRFGNVVCIRGILTWNRDKEYYNSAAWRGKWKTEGGGVLINQALHTLDLMVYLSGGVESLRADMKNYTLEEVIEVEDTCTAVMKLKNGGTGVLFATNAYASDSKYDIEVVFENGSAHYVDNKLFVNDTYVCNDTTIDGKKSYWGTSHEELIRNFYKDNVYFCVDDVKNTMYSLFAIYESARNNGETVLIQEK